MQADQKPLSVVISGVTACHVSASAAGSFQDNPQSSAQQHSDRAAALQSASRVSSAEQPREQARPSRKRRSGIDSASAAQAAAERLDGHPVPMQTSGTDADREAAVPRKCSKRELSHITEGQETLRQGSEAAMEALQSLGACAANGTAAYGRDYRDSEERCLQHFIGSVPGATGDQTHLMIGVACNSKISSCSSMYRIRVLIHAFSSMCSVRMHACMMAWLQAKGCPVMMLGSHNKL